MKRTPVFIFAAFCVAGCTNTNQSVSAPTTLPTALSGSYFDKTQEWAAAVAAAKRNAAMEQFEKDMRQVESDMKSSK